MKTYKITVNNKVYEVEVEEIGASTAPRPAVQSPAPAAAPKAPAAAPKAAPAAPKAAPAPVGGNKIDAPMPGTILDILVAAGDQVQEGQVLVILEAMKMENEIMAPSAGTVAQVIASKGASVNAGDALLVLE